ncbi:uncharacterized protein LOC114529073 isoform X2 [Dendronephthya gigantea]|nr:uncharacterized protein LOC114529073 isoform X2 [Dendronephthya gigantea]XP_028406599.1 uncharacterized protein LOC114529073 isoform X2 [Dendronephthya gigantea]
METNQVPGNSANPPQKPRRLPEIPKDQEPFDITKIPPKPPRQRPRGQRCSTPDLQRRVPGSIAHKRCRSVESIRLSPNPENEERSPLSSKNGNLKHANSSFNSPAFLDTTSCKTTRNPSSPRLSLPAYCGEGAIFIRRCTNCHQRIFPEEERFVIAQSMLFHLACFQCSICNKTCDITDYCYVMEHEKFYCLRHYHEMVAAGIGIVEGARTVYGSGPGAFAAVVGKRRKRKETLKTLTELQHRRTKLAQIAFQLEEAMKMSKNEERAFLWKHWFDVTYEKSMIARAVAEFAYQLKEVELCNEQEQLQKKLRRIRREKKKGNQEDLANDEETCLHDILNVIEKRDLLLLELEIERRRDDEESRKLKSLFEGHLKKGVRAQNIELSCDSQNGQCVIL